MGVRWLSSTIVNDAPLVIATGASSTEVDDALMVSKEAEVGPSKVRGGTNVVEGQERSKRGVVVMAVPTTPKAGFGEVG